MVTVACGSRGRLQVDGPYDKAFLEKLHKCPAEDDGSIEYAVAKVTLTLLYIKTQHVGVFIKRDCLLRCNSTALP